MGSEELVKGAQADREASRRRADAHRRGGGHVGNGADLADDLPRVRDPVDRLSVDEDLELALDEHPDLRADLALADDLRAGGRFAHDAGGDQGGERPFAHPGEIGILLEDAEEFGLVHAGTFYHAAHAVFKPSFAPVPLDRSAPDLTVSPITHRRPLAGTRVSDLANPNPTPSIMALHVGAQAPDFELTTLGANGPEIVRLADQLGEGNLLLLFVPMAFTGVCTTELCSVTSELSDYEGLNAKVFGISGDNPFAQQNWKEKENIGIPLLSDYEHEVAKAYGVAYSSFLPEKNLKMGGVPKRSAFIVDKAGIVQYAESSDNPGDLPDFEAIKAKLKELA